MALHLLHKAMREAPATVPCQETDPEAFFPEQGVRPTEAIALCNTCPVITQCRDYAIWHFEDFGVWGGTTPEQRQKIRKEKGIKPRWDNAYLIGANLR